MAVLHDNVVADKVYESKGEDDFLLGQQVEEESSTIGFEIDEGKEDATFDFQWEAPLDDWQRTGLQPPVHIARRWSCWAGSSSCPPSRQQWSSDPSREYLTGLVVKLMT